MVTADTIWHSGSILTMDPASPHAQAMAAKDGRLIAVGQDADVLNLTGPETSMENLGGRFVMPGLIEPHTHALWGACRTLFDVYVGYGASLDTLLEATRARARQLAPGDVVFGGPWRHDMRSDMGDRPRDLLDAISTEHPIVLADTSQHILWCNSHALDLAGIGPETPDIPGGVIERDSSGTPRGILAESAGASARALIQRSPAQMAEAARECVRYFNELGFTGFKEPMAFEPDLQAYHRADQRGELTLHMAAHIVRTSPLGDMAVPYETLERLRKQYATDNIRTGFAKLFLDGVAPGFTASFIDPYLPESGYDADTHDADATLLLPPVELNETVAELDRRGFVVKMHAVGDNAIRKGLDAIAAARAENGQSGLRHEIAHCNYVSDADLGRFAELGAVAEMSPKMWYPNPATPIQRALLGDTRLAKSHRMADLLAAGAELVCASDWPAAAPDANPWTGLAGLLTRQNADPAYPGTLSPDQAISLADALPLLTTNGARAMRMEGETGMLRAGHWADFVVLDRSLPDIEPAAIAETQVEQTHWKGQRVFAR